MSQENGEVVRAYVKAWDARDMDAVRDLHDPDAVARPAHNWPEPGPYVGREAVIRWLEQLHEAWDADDTEAASDFIEVGDRVAVRIIWRGAGHGPEANIEFSAIYTVREGRISSHEYFWDHAEALKAVGLEE